MTTHPVYILIGIVVVGMMGPPGSAHAQQTQLFTTPIRVIYPGEEITPSALSEGMGPTNEEAGTTIRDVHEAIGKIARRILLPHRPILCDALGPKAIVTSGKRIEASFVESGVEIIAKVIALQDGWRGDVIQVRNIDSGKIIIGKVLSDDRVQVTSP